MGGPDTSRLRRLRQIGVADTFALGAQDLGT